jgi:hypothetical protein
MQELGRVLVALGIVLVVTGAVLLLLGRTGLPLGRLPGDVAYHGKRFSLFAPLGTSLLLSALLSLAFYLLARFRR